jgi:hypothetical protein
MNINKTSDKTSSLKKLFLLHDKWTVAILKINSESKLWVKNALFAFKMASETSITLTRYSAIF